jgi:hypothetical protein
LKSKHGHRLQWLPRSPFAERLVAEHFGRPDNICRCTSVARSGTISMNMRPTPIPSGASNGMGLHAHQLPTAFFSPLTRPCGIATP